MIVRYFMNSAVLAKLKHDVGDRQFGPLSKIVVDEALPDGKYVVEHEGGTEFVLEVPDADGGLAACVEFGEWASTASVTDLLNVARVMKFGRR